MESFLLDLHQALDNTETISKERARSSWGVTSLPLIDWQHEVFLLLKESDHIKNAWSAWDENNTTKRQAKLLHYEIEVIIDFHERFIFKNKHSESRKERPLKKALELMKTLLKSIKDIFGELLGSAGKALIQLAIEATEAFL